MARPAEVRRRFLAALLAELRSSGQSCPGLIGAQLALGIVVGRLENWKTGDAVYSTFVTGLTIGYGRPRAVSLGLAHDRGGDRL